MKKIVLGYALGVASCVAAVTGLFFWGKDTDLFDNDSYPYH